ncbi:DUF736 domain-containing protein [Asticcacaulis endophyticus]|uniref:DUF736 domain-containing protein n=1 Tax=Asticcacaulis endophyticus TaxID=1395890 RepID=A0A918Q6F2_9CAUL|nr:DUF736 domain-containing protein [Asticcacaulis endophyticus]GGZ32576.1 hypothetical protein GCM10011273_18430 [Asticcacaulis endophyticus]
MTQIGHFTRIRGLFSGRIKTLTLDAHIVLLPINQTDAANVPDYRIHLGDGDGPEIGAGWRRTGERAGDFISINIDDPLFSAPIRANLFQQEHDKKVWVLNWNRHAKRDESV